MGIHGIYKEIGPGQRIAFSKLAVDKFEETGRPLRIAIDVSIWLFQIQASKGGTNPALRTFYYRLLRLIALSIHPIFVFDGPNKPPFKRNKRTGPNFASIPEFLAKQLLKQFGFPIHLAPGEAEAECALLQREGIVDAVLSEDVDTLMFGSGVTIRNWSPEQKTGKTPTHVNVYDAAQTKNGPSGLDREGMILIALMSGGDYVPEGIPGCGPKLACEAARGGFGRDLCKIAKHDAKAMQEWRERLRHELKTNESKIFSRKRPSLKIPDEFPRTDILGYYTHPAISSPTGLEKLKRSINWDQDLNYAGLRSFTYDAFNWVKLEGAKHFIRTLAPSILVRQLRMRGEETARSTSDDLQAVQDYEALLVKGIHGKRQHMITDNTTELRVSFTPIELVNIDLEDEEPDQDLEEHDAASEANSDDELPLEMDDDAEAGPKKRGPTKFDPDKPARVWVLETFVKVGVPLTVEDWEASRQKPLKTKRNAKANGISKVAPKKQAARRGKTTGDAPQPSIQSFAKVTKPGVKLSQAFSKAQSIPSEPPIPSQTALPPTNDIIDLLSSSPPRPMSANLPPQQTRDKSLSAVLEELPPSVTKRRRRAPMQRSHTSPANLAPAIDPSGATRAGTTETFNLEDLPVLPSPSRVPAKKARMQASRNPPVARHQRGTSITSSPVKTRQTTLDAWCSSPANSPTKPRRSPSHCTEPVAAPPGLQSRHGVETLDLTLSSPLCPIAPEQIRASKNPRRSTASASTARPPLVPISSNASQQSTTSSSYSDKSSKLPSRRSSPRLQRKRSASLEIDSVDLTLFTSPAPVSTHPTPIPAKPHHSATPSSQTHHSQSITRSIPLDPVAPIDPFDISDLLPSASMRPTPRRSPRISRIPSPPAAWKTQAKKKREIILRKSLAGAWDFVEVESPAKGDTDQSESSGHGGRVPKVKERRRRWRESEVEVLDLC